MINPVNHAKSPGDVAVYKVEPYVMAADVYVVDPHAGRGVDDQREHFVRLRL